MRHTTARVRLFFFLSLIIFLPLLEYVFPVIKSGELRGAVVKNPDVKFSISKWIDDSYQKQKELFLNDNIGFRPDMVRLNNQIEFSCFKKLHAEGVYLGYDDYLFDKGYVDEYEGVEYMGADVIRNELIKIKLIQDTLERMGKTFILTYAPSKPYIVPEKIPDILRPRDGKKINNYTTFKTLGDSLKINQLDFNALFMAMKDTAHNPIITKQGYHWSVYGSLLAADTLIKYIERERTIKMPELTITALHHTTTAQDGDNDFVTFANLLLPITKENFCYPEFHYNVDATKTRPKVIYIGDSFVWQWVHYGFMQNTNSDWQFWHYFNVVWNQKILDGGGKPIDIVNYNWQKQLSDADCIIVVFTPRNLHIFDSKDFFVEKMYNYFYPGKK